MAESLDIDRDRVLELFLAGASYRSIAKSLKQTEADVEDAVRSAMGAATARREYLAANVDAVALERREALFRSQYPIALAGGDGSAAAAKVCIALLEGMRDNVAGVGDVAASAASTEAVLLALRTRLVAEIDACRDARKLTSLSRQLLAVLAEIDSKITPPGSKRDDLKAKREQRRAAARGSESADSGRAGG